MNYLGSYLFQNPVFNEPNSAWITHIPFAFFLVEKLKPKIFVELGTHYGNSYFSFCQAVNELKTPTKTYAVDLWTGDKHAGFYNNEVFEKVNEINNNIFFNFSCLLKMSFDDALNSFDDDSIDLLHIDGLHTYEAVKHDYETWLHKMSNKGVIIFHEINVKKSDFGVWKLFDEIKLQFPYIEFTHGFGLGLICVGNEIDNDFLNFVNTFNQHSFFKQLFECLGDRITLLRSNEILKKEIIKYNSDINSLKESFCSKNIVLEEKLKLKEIELSQIKNKYNQIYNSFFWKIAKHFLFINSKNK